MTSITISDICPPEYKLLSGSKSYMTELNENERGDVVGGIICGGACVVGLAAGAAFLTGAGIGIALNSDS